MDPIKTNSGETQPSASLGIEGTTQQQQRQQQLQDGEKEDGQVSLDDLGKADEVGASKEAGAPSAVHKHKEGEQDKAGVVTGGDGVSTDIPSITADPMQEVKRDPIGVKNSTLSDNDKTF